MGNKQGKPARAAGVKAAAAGAEGAGKDLPYDQYAFPFENAVFEGGPGTLLPYVGAVRFLEEVGIWRSVVRLGGTGEGALLAALLSLGYNSRQLENFFQDDLRKLTQDHSCGGCCLGCNVSSTFGWNPNKRLTAWLGSKIATSCGKSDITFLQVFEKFGKELCIVVTNVSQGSVEYCHHKTTPNLSIITAVRMSMTTPVLQSVVKHKPFSEQQLYVQGGILANYPLHCYDGWWLSGTLEDSFAVKQSSAGGLPATLDSLPGFLDQSRFNQYNNKTLGFIVYDDSTFDQWTSKLDERNKLKEKCILPETKLSKSCGEERLACRSIEDKYAKFAAAANKILPALAESMPEMNKLIAMNEFEGVLKKVSNVSSAELEIFFSGKSEVDDICALVCPRRMGQVCRQDILQYVERTTVSYEAQYRRWKHHPTRCLVSNLTEFLEAVERTELVNNRSQRVSIKDVDRTIGINIRYISGQLRNEPFESADSTFMLEQGRASAKAFLDNYVSQGVPAIKETPSRRSFCRDDLPSFIDDDVSEIIDERDYMENLIGRVL